jgi:protocatechuate 3,4-dioxygenase beta subunit
MDRKDFLKGIGLAGAGVVISQSKSIACTVIPTETAGPYPILSTQLAATLRSDMRESIVGQLHTIKLKIIGDSNCLPLANAEVDVWHCNPQGHYSGYTTSGKDGSVNDAGKTYLRGRAMTDSNGEVTFTTIFPGWYSGRICHVHFEVKVGGTSMKISQFTYPKTEKDQIHTTIAPYNTWGIDPAVSSSDNVFSDGTTGQIATLVYNSTTLAWDSYLEVTVAGTGTAGVKNIEHITGGQFELGQNYPNPHLGVTTVPFTLTANSEVSFGIYNLQGRRVAEVKPVKLGAGEHQMAIDCHQLNIPVGTYAYEITVKNSIGIYSQCKMMTAE